MISATAARRGHRGARSSNNSSIVRSDYMCLRRQYLTADWLSWLECGANVGSIPALAILLFGPGSMTSSSCTMTYHGLWYRVVKLAEPISQGVPRYDVKSAIQVAL